MKAFVTGATGFIGGRVASKLQARGYDVWALVRPGRGAALASQGIHTVPGDLADVDALRRGMRDSDVVYHIAGWYKIGDRDPGQGMVVNVQGTRNVLGVASELNIPRIIYTSTVAVFGDTHGYAADEDYVIPGTENGLAPAFKSEYDRTKWLAHYHVALPLQRAGAPITIVMPGVVYGPGDTSQIGGIMRRFYTGQMPVVPAPETVLTYAYVDDVAEGHILAAERGKRGENYILAGPALSFGELFNLWSDITGLPGPAVRVPAAVLHPLAPVVGLLGKVAPLPEMYTAEGIRYMGGTHIGSSAKAQRELGWETRSLRDGMSETFAWIAGQTGPAPESWAARNQVPVAAGVAAGALLAFLLYRFATRGKRS